MPAISSAQKSQIEFALTTRHAQLLAEIREELAQSGQQHFADLAGEVADVGDASVADLLVDQNIAIVRRQVEELTRIEAAQKHLHDADFGACSECGLDISLQRLLVVPDATRCIVCQGQHEKTYSHESTPKL